MKPTMRVLSILLAVPAFEASAEPNRTESPAAAAPQTNKARSKTLGIFVLSGEEVGAPRSEVYAELRKEIEVQTALDVAGLEVFPSSMREGAIRECAGQGECFAEKARQAGVDVDLLLLVSAKRLGEGVLVGMRLLDLRMVGGKAELAAVGEELPEGMSVLRGFTTYLSRVFPAEIWGQVASLRVEVDQENAEILVGPRACVSPCRVARVLPGTYEITARKSGYREWHGSVAAEAGKEAQVSVQLIEEEGGSMFSSVWFWGAVGTGVVAATVATVLLVQPPRDTFLICLASSAALCDK